MIYVTLVLCVVAMKFIYDAFVRFNDGRKLTKPLKDRIEAENDPQTKNYLEWQYLCSQERVKYSDLLGRLLGLAYPAYGVIKKTIFCLKNIISPQEHDGMDLIRYKSAVSPLDFVGSLIMLYSFKFLIDFIRAVWTVMRLEENQREALRNNYLTEEEKAKVSEFIKTMKKERNKTLGRSLTKFFACAIGGFFITLLN